jgi:hypothetical protein
MFSPPNRVIKNIVTSKKNHSDCFLEHRCELPVDFFQINDAATDIRQVTAGYSTQKAWIYAPRLYHHCDHASRLAPNWTYH